MVPAIFLDRDGVVIENEPDYVRYWSQVQIFPKAIDILSNPTIKNFKVVVVTNQAAIGRQLLSLETAEEINHRLMRTLRQYGCQIDSIYMCPHKPEDECHCRKPQPGMLLQAANELSIDLSTSWMIGDAWSDLLAGQAAGVRGVMMVKTGRGTTQLSLPKPAHLKEYSVFNDLSEAIQTIFNFKP